MSQFNYNKDFSNHISNNEVMQINTDCNGNNSQNLDTFYDLYKLCTKVDSQPLKENYKVLPRNKVVEQFINKLKK